MNAIDIITLVSAGVSVYCYLCRVDGLMYGKHRFDIVSMHIGFGCGSVMAGVHAWEGRAGYMEAVFILTALLWIKVSWRTWRDGKVPKQFVTHPAEFDSEPIGRSFK